MTIRFSAVVPVVPILVISMLGACSPPDQKSAGSNSFSASQSVSPPKMASGDDCATSNVPMSKLESKAAGEPILEIPQPTGWTYSTAINSERIRGAIFNTGLSANQFTPNAAVTLVDVTEDATSPQQALDTERAGMVQSGVAITSETSGTLCGRQTRTINYPIEDRAGTTLIVADKFGQRIWVATLTIQTTRPDDPTYKADKQIILDGFRFGPPAS
ncbi:hypothetical protein [Mycobacteroides abscessus]|uniref:hypothetical protein n=1 Tax=Mycobacteroides abscessus TaxID=36809 RepID=UPI001F3EFF5C|nr:hypothetical protein [Mycobacteroides abscessus]